jgi:hypothetical protein
VFKLKNKQGENNEIVLSYFITKHTLNFMESSLDKMVDAAVSTLIRIKDFTLSPDMLGLNNAIKAKHFTMMAEAFKNQQDLAHIGESIDKLYQYLDKPYVLEVQLGCIISNLLAIKRKENILIKFSHN